MNSTYELTVAYKTNMGISPSTMFTMEAATAITTAPTSPPQNIIVQVLNPGFFLAATKKISRTVHVYLTKLSVSFHFTTLLPRINCFNPVHCLEEKLQSVGFPVGISHDSSSWN